MNWNDIKDQIVAAYADDETRAFMLGVAMAVGVRVIRWGIRWVSRFGSAE